MVVPLRQIEMGKYQQTRNLCSDPLSLGERIYV